MMLTRRDLDVISFLEDYKIASTSTLKHFYFPSLLTCQNRMKILFDNGRVKRARLTMNHDYFYYVTKPKQYMHSLIITEFYRELAKRTEVTKFILQKKLGKIIPDSIFLCKSKEEQIMGLLEVELSHKGFDYNKYEEFYSTGAYKEFFPKMPNVYVVGRDIKLPKDTKINYIKLKNDLSDFRL